MTPPLDPGLYPASYRTPVWKGCLRIFGFMALFWFYTLAHPEVLYSGGVALFAMLVTLLLLLALGNATFAKVTLYPDRIERVTWFGAKSVLRADVIKLERRRHLFFRNLYLVSRKGHFEDLLMPIGIEADAAWDAWMPVAQDACMPTKSAMLRGGRIALAVMTLLVSLGCLIAALVTHVEVKRLATETPVTATVAQVRSKMYKGNLIYSVRLIFDRKQGDGNVVHCDVPDVEMGMRSTKLGEAIKVSPQNTSCFAPHIICDTCAAPSDVLALDMLMVAVVSGLICFLLFWITSREKDKLA